MNKTYPLIFGIGNPLVDVVIQASESDLINIVPVVNNFQCLFKGRNIGVNICNYCKGFRIHNL